MKYRRSSDKLNNAPNNFTRIGFKTKKAICGKSVNLYKDLWNDYWEEANDYWEEANEYSDKAKLEAHQSPLRDKIIMR